MSRTVLLMLAVLTVAALWAPQQAHAAEFRGFWVDAWGSGYENPTATTTMLDYVQACNCNAVIVEMRKRGDAYYTSSLVPTGINVTPQAGYDCLADIVTKAHARSLEVHAWVVVWRVWTFTTPPATTTPDHVFNTHPEWFNLTDTGAKFDAGNGSYLDPGHPEVENHVRDVFMEIINNYDIDGFTLDYIRYPGTAWGYNATSVARYNAEYGLSGNPSSGDVQWSNWRRDQVTNLVKRMYVEAKAVKPAIKMGAAIWNSSATGNSSYFQNWALWMQNHYLDYGSPMAYTTTNSTFNGWVDTYYGQQYGRHIYVSQGSYMNTIANSMVQIEYVQAKPMPGVNPYDYRVTNSGTVDRAGFQAALLAGPFATPQTVPTMSWISAPTLGMLKGFVKDGTGAPVYPATVTVSTQSTKDSGMGFYGFVELTPNTYTVTASAPGYTNGTGQATIVAGQVTTLDLTLGTDSAPPIISNVRTANVQATNAQILWDTDEASTSQVEYGLTTSYGSLTTEDPALVTAHTVQLTGLTANTLYHYRVISKDGANNAATSGDYTFTTALSDVVADIIIDNPQCTLVGSWTTGTSSTDKYGTNYYYTTTATSETKSATWTPTIITAGNYDVFCWYPQGSNRSAMAPYTVTWNGGSQTVSVNQQANGGRWNTLVSAKPFAVGTAGKVKLGNGTGESALNVMADAVKFVYNAPADTQPPSVPTGLNATAVSCTQVNLTWTASTDNVGVTGYKVFRNAAQIGTSGTTSYSDTTCSPNTSYTYTVSAYDAASNESAQSSPATVTTPADTTAPSAPTNLVGTPVSQTQVNLTWTASTDNIGVTGYKVYRNSLQIGTSATTSYSDTTCSPSTTYTYEVSAYDAAANESPRSNQAVVTTPGGVTTKNYAPTAITITRGTLTSGSVTNLAVNDASYLVINGQKVNNIRYVDWYSKVTIAEAPASITKLTITFDGKLSASLTQVLYVYNFSAASWTQIDSRTVGTSDVTITWPTTAPSPYISSAGEIRCRQYVTRSSSFSSSTDFVQFQVEF